MERAESEAPRRIWWRPALTLVQILAVVALPATLTLMTVEDPGKLQFSTDDPTPLGYTWSLLLFILPMTYLAWWFLRHRRITFQKKSFWTTQAILVPLGFLLDIFFGRLFRPRQEGAALDVHEVRGHHDELRGEIDVENLEGLDVCEVLLGNPFDRDVLDIDFVLLDEVEEEIEGAFEDFELDLVVGSFHAPSHRGGRPRERGKIDRKGKKNRGWQAGRRGIGTVRRNGP